MEKHSVDCDNMPGLDTRRSHERDRGGLWKGIPLFWRFQIAGWAAFFVMTFPIKVSLSGSVGDSLLSFFVRDGFSFLITLVFREIYRRAYDQRLSHSVMIGLVASVSLAGAALQIPVYLVANHAFPFEEQTFFSDSPLVGIFYYRLGLYLGWSLLYVGIRQTRDAMRRELQLVSVESDKRAAEIQLLRAQMNPHFLLNALNAIQAGLTRAPESLRPVVQALADYLSFSLAHRDQRFIPVGDEYDALVAYLEVEKARFRDDIEIECLIDPTAREFPVPGILLQPLVENAIGYGRKTSPKPLRLRMHVSRLPNSSLIVEVANTGTWVEEENAQKFGGIGLGNVRKRMELLYPDRHRIDMKAEKGWVTVRIEIAA